MHSLLLPTCSVKRQDTAKVSMIHSEPGIKLSEEVRQQLRTYNDQFEALRECE